MEIKSLLKNKSTRRRMLRLIQWMPDRWYLSFMYWASLGRFPELRHPKRFTEKIQLYKMYYRNSLMLECANKFKFRQYIESLKINNCYLPILYHHTDNIETLDLNLLPEKFVIKSSDGGNGENVLIVKDKKNLNWNSTKYQVKNWENKHYEVTSREWAYSGNEKTTYLIEELLEDNNSLDKSLIDYKFFCFNGIVKFFKIDFSRFKGHKANYYNPKGELIEVEECVYPSNPELQIPVSVNIPEMILIAEKLAKPFPFVRVDFYNINGKIYAGELTFYPMSGFGRFNPDSFDLKAGEFFTLYH